MAHKPGSRFATLDAIRGLCAIIVMMEHSRILTGYDPFPKGYLVVDLFFLMSGFVLGHAYDSRLKAGGYVGKFMLRRYARLFPMWALGVSLGSLWPLYNYYKAGGIATWGLYFIFQLSFIPTFWNARLPLNYLLPYDSPGWSLFFELASNLIYGFASRVLNLRNLFFLVAIAWIALSWMSFRHGGLEGGAQWGQAEVGLARVMFSFFLGILIYRLPRPQLGRSGAMPIFLLLLAALIGLSHYKIDNGVLFFRAIRDIITVSIFMPLLMWSALRTSFNRLALAEVLGIISYPLYAIHLPALLIFEAVYTHVYGWNTNGISVIWTYSLLIFVVFISYLLGRFIDPASQRFTGRLIHQSAPAVPGS